MSKIILSGASALVSPRAVFAAPRADGGEPAQLFAQLQNAVNEMRQKHEESLQAKVDDVVLKEHITRIDASISEWQASLESMARAIEAQKLGGDQRRVVDPEYTADFVAFMRDGGIRASLNKTTDGDGGYLAPSEWDRTITDKLVEVSPMRAIATVIRTTTGSFKKLVNLRGTASGWVDEDDARTETAGPAFGSVEFPTGELYANPAATQQLLEDAAIDLESWLAGEIQTEFGKAEGTAFVSGNGSKRPFGFLSYVTGGAAAGRNPIGNITTVNSGNAALLTTDGVVSLVYALASAYRGNARFVMNRGTEAALRKLKDGQGNYIWQPSYAVGTPATLMGYPITEMADMPDVAANALALAFGDFRAGYLINDRVDTSILRDPYSNKPYVQFYARKRVGGGVVQPQALVIQKVAA